MNRHSLILLLSLAGCMAEQPVPEKPERADIPIECPPVPAPPHPLGRVVDVERLREWADATEVARQETAKALRICSHRIRVVAGRIQ